MRAARIKLSPELLGEALHMPRAARITGAGYDTVNGWVILVVDDPSLPEADEPHDANPTVRNQRWLWDWNIQ